MGLFSGVGKALGSFVGDLTGANAQADAAKQAAKVQAGMSKEGIAETRRQFDKIVELMTPFITGGTKAFDAQGALAGLQGQEAQNKALQGISNSPEMQAYLSQGENAILQNASATGGLRGGNTQGALAQFRPRLLAQLIEQQYGRLGNLSQLGQASAGMQASAGQNAGANIANLLAQQGAATAGGIMAKGGAQRQAFGDLLQLGSAAAAAFL